MVYTMISISLMCYINLYWENHAMTEGRAIIIKEVHISPGRTSNAQTNAGLNTKDKRNQTKKKWGLSWK